MKELTPKLKSNIKQYFDNHSTVDQFYFTSDGQCFRKEDDALNHAKHLAFHKLGTADIDTYTRAQVDGWSKAATKPEKEKEVVLDPPPPPPGNEGDNNPPPPPAVVYADMGKPELITECKKRKIKVTGSETKPNLIKLLEANDAKKK